MTNLKIFDNKMPKALGKDMEWASVAGMGFQLTLVRAAGGGGCWWVGLVGRGRRTDSVSVWNTYARGWLRHYGPPEVLITDGGGEFDQEFWPAIGLGYMTGEFDREF